MKNFEEDNISRLKFIGKIKKGEKIDIKNMLIQPNNMYTKIQRTFVIVDDRNNTLNFILETINKSFNELLIHLNKSKDNLFDLNIASNMMLDLQSAKNGLNNLKDTYAEDLMFGCKIDTIIQDVEARLEDIKSSYEFVKQKTCPINIPTKNVLANNTTQLDVLNDLLPSSCSSVESNVGSLLSYQTTRNNE